MAKRRKKTSVEKNVTEGILCSVFTQRLWNVVTRMRPPSEVNHRPVRSHES